MHFKSMAVGVFQANCYLLGCPETKEALVIDPGGEPDQIEHALEAAGLRPVAYLLTHGHLDHVGAATPLKSRLGGEILLHPADEFLYKSASTQAQAYGVQIPEVVPADNSLEDGQEIVWGAARGRVFCTPGHSPGSICLAVAGKLMSPETAQAPDWVFTGDTLFMGSIGRTDLPGGGYEELMGSIREKLLPLDNATVIASGHGPLTTIGREKEINPFVQELLG